MPVGAGSRHSYSPTSAVDEIVARKFTLARPAVGAEAGEPIALARLVDGGLRIGDDSLRERFEDEIADVGRVSGAGQGDTLTVSISVHSAAVYEFFYHVQVDGDDTQFSGENWYATLIASASGLANADAQNAGEHASWSHIGSPISPNLHDGQFDMSGSGFLRTGDGAAFFTLTLTLNRIGHTRRAADYAFDYTFHARRLA